MCQYCPSEQTFAYSPNIRIPGPTHTRVRRKKKSAILEERAQSAGFPKDRERERGLRGTQCENHCYMLCGWHKFRGNAVAQEHGIEFQFGFHFPVYFVVRILNGVSIENALIRPKKSLRYWNKKFSGELNHPLSINPLTTPHHRRSLFSTEQFGRTLCAFTLEVGPTRRSSDVAIASSRSCRAEKCQNREKSSFSFVSKRSCSCFNYLKVKISKNMAHRE